jgi:hypothetical protein
MQPAKAACCASHPWGFADPPTHVNVAVEMQAKAVLNWVWQLGNGF